MILLCFYFSQNVHPHHYASFKLSVNTSDTEGEVHADVWIQSEFQKIVFPFYMNVAKGYLRVSPDPFEFEDCFPVRIVLVRKLSYLFVFIFYRLL